MEENKQSDILRDSLLGEAYKFLSRAFYELSFIRHEIFVLVGDHRIELPEKRKKLELILKRFFDLRGLLLVIDNELKKILLEKDDVIIERTHSKIYYKLTVANLNLTRKKLKKAIIAIDRLTKKVKSALIKNEEINKRRFHIILIGYFVELKKFLSVVDICMREVIKISELNYLFNQKFGWHILPRSSLQKGDILLSYKTERYLKKHLLSKLISIVEKSRITHTSIVFLNNPENLMILTAKADNEMLSFRNLEIEEGEVEFVLRPILSEKQKKRLDDLLEEWYVTLKKSGKTYKFSELKCWSAVVLGLIYEVTIGLFSRSLILPNIFRRKNAYFCSEVVDTVFKQNDILLSTRSQYNSIVGPSEFFYSPYLEFIGIICNKQDKELLKDERIYI